MALEIIHPIMVNPILIQMEMDHLIRMETIIKVVMVEVVVMERAVKEVELEIMEISLLAWF